MTTPTPQRSRTKGWIIAVIVGAVAAAVLLVVSAFIVAVILLNRAQTARKINEAKQSSTQAQIANLKTALTTFETDNGRYPTENEGLKAMVVRPPALPQWHQTLEEVPQDAWGHDFKYVFPGKNDPESFELISAGADGKFGTSDDMGR